MKVVNRVALNNGFTGIGLGGYATTGSPILQVAKSAIIHERTGYNGTGNLMFCNDGTTNNNDVSNTHARMTITSSGNVGIGTTNPGSVLHVVGDVAISSNLAVDTNTLFVDSVGNKVGIGRTDPGASLDVNGNIIGQVIAKTRTITKGSSFSDETETFTLNPDENRIFLNNNQGNIGSTRQYYANFNAGIPTEIGTIIYLEIYSRRYQTDTTGRGHRSEIQFNGVSVLSTGYHILSQNKTYEKH